MNMYRINQLRGEYHHTKHNHILNKADVDKAPPNHLEKTFQHVLIILPSYLNWQEEEPFL